MKWGIVTFPGSNDDRATARVLSRVLGQETCMLWHKDYRLPELDCIILPGGFSYGDYLRCGSMARFSPIMGPVREFCEAGGLVLGICNGFQILCEAGILPGALIRNRSLLFVCQRVHLKVENTDTPFTHRYRAGEVIRLPIKHGEGAYVASEEVLEALEREGRILLRYADADGQVGPHSNPNGSMRSIAAVLNERGNVLGLMPHPEYAVETLTGSEDGRRLFLSIIEAHASGAWRRAGRGSQNGVQAPPEAGNR